MKTTLLAIACAAALSAAGASTTLTGIITDSMCGVSHSMMKGHADDDCVRMCVKGSAEYALYDGKNIWKLSDQKTPARFMAKHVKVTGTVDEKAMRIKVASIEADE